MLRVLLGVSTVLSAMACSDIALHSNHTFTGRSLDYSLDDPYGIYTFPRSHPFNSSTPDGDRGASWVAEYGFISVTSERIGDVLFTMDGLSEMGVSVSLLYLAGSRWPDVSTKLPETVMAVQDVPLRIMGTCRSITEAQQLLSSDQVWVWGDSPLHIVVRDERGQGLVVEWIEGVPVFYAQDTEVVTNQPSFDYMLKSLGVQQWEQGLARSAVGVPGEWYPVARFLRAHMVNKALPVPLSDREAVANVLTLLDTVQVPSGAPGTDSEGSSKNGPDHTQWSVVRDHGKRILYYRTVANPQLQAVSLESIDFRSGAPLLRLEMENIKVPWFADAVPRLLPLPF